MPSISGYTAWIGNKKAVASLVPQKGIFRVRCYTRTRARDPWRLGFEFYVASAMDTPEDLSMYAFNILREDWRKLKRMLRGLPIPQVRW